MLYKYVIIYITVYQGRYFSMKKRILSLLLILSLMFSFAAVTGMTASATTDETGDWEYTILDDGTVEVTEYYSDGTYVAIPDEIDGKAVTSVGANVFRLCNSSIISVTIPNSVKTVKGSAFSDCTALTGVIIPDGVITVEGSAFCGCTNLKSVEIPSSVTTIGDNAFGYYLDAENSNYAKFEKFTVICYDGSVAMSYAVNNGFSYKLYTSNSDFTYGTLADGTLVIYKYNGSAEEVIIPGKIGDSIVSTVYGNAFRNTTTTASIIIPNSVKTINNNAFYNLANLTSIVIPEGVTSIGENAFYGTGITSVTVPSSVARMGKQSFAYCTKLENAVINAKTVGNGTFGGCTALSAVTVGKGTDTVENYAFRGCTALNSADINAKYIGDNVFFGCTALSALTIGNNVKTIGKNAFYQCPITSIVIPESVTDIGNYAFYECKSLENAEINARIIGDSAFDGCSKLSSLTLGDKVVTVGKYAFSDCANLLYATLGNSVCDIGGSAFKGCAKLSSLTLGAVYSIGVNAFENCTSLTSIELPNGARIIESYAFRGCTSLSNVKLNSGIENIGYSAFGDCTSLSSISLPDSISYVGCDAFYNTAIYNNADNWNNGVLYIGKCLISAAFGYYDEEDNFTATDEVEGNYIIKDGTKVIADSAFFDCTKLTGITFPDSIEYINASAFHGCSSLTSVAIPNSVKTIDYCTFEGCSSLTDLTIGDGVESVDYYAFYNCPNLKNVTIPDSVTSIGDMAFGFYFDEEEFDDLTVKDFCITCNDNTAAAQYAVENGFNYRIFSRAESFKHTEIDENSVKITGYTGNANIIDIPSEINGKKVIGIDDNAFCNCEKILSVTIPNGIESIGSSAFERCGAITSIEIPNSVICIGDNAFYCCEALADVKIGDGVDYIGCNAFYFTALYANADNWDSGVLYIDDCLISGMYLTAEYDSQTGEPINFITAAEVEGDYAIKDGTRLIAAGAFCDCTKLTGVTIPDSITVIGEGAFYCCTKLSSVSIPDSATIIDGSAFYECTSLTSIVIPDSVTVIGSGAFDSCTNLSDVTLGNGLEIIGEGAFEDCTSLTGIVIPNSVTTVEIAAFNNCTKLSSVKIGGGVKSIAYEAFYGCTSLKNVIIPNSVTAIDEYAFGYYFDDETAKDEKVADFHIECGVGTAAEKYAVDNGFDYSAHEYEHHNAAPASCEQAGMQEYYSCKNCDKVFDKDKVETTLKELTIAATGHTEETIEGKAASCTESGLTDGKKCSVCGEILTKRTDIPATGHTYVKVDEVPATYESGGVKEHYECSVCGTLFDMDKNEVAASALVIPKLEKTVNYGDLNGDSKINLLDLVAMRKHLAKWTLEIDKDAADCNADGKINLLDLVLMRKYLAKWNVVLGPQK